MTDAELLRNCKIGLSALLVAQDNVIDAGGAKCEEALFFNEPIKALRRAIAALSSRVNPPRCRSHHPRHARSDAAVTPPCHGPSGDTAAHSATARAPGSTAAAVGRRGASGGSASGAGCGHPSLHQFLGQFLE